MNLNYKIYYYLNKAFIKFKINSFLKFYIKIKFKLSKYLLYNCSKIFLKLILVII